MKEKKDQEKSLDMHRYLSSDTIFFDIGVSACLGESCSCVTVRCDYLGGHATLLPTGLRDNSSACEGD